MKSLQQLSLVTSLILLFGLYQTTQAGPLELAYRAYDKGDYKSAMKIWLPLAEKKDPDAAFNMALLYKNGHGVKKNPRMAMKWFKQAAFHGSADAAYNLGVMYNSGAAGFPSKKDAVYWWKQAAEQGHHESQYNYGVMLAYGSGVAKDEAAAVGWWKLAAETGNDNAIKALIQGYEQGKFGLPNDPKKAAYWKRFLQR